MARPKPLAELIESSLAPALAKQGFSGADIVESWPDIVGERLAAWSQPLRVDWKRRAPDGTSEPATLVIRVESAFAVELQHLAPAVIERVNGFYGWACIGRLVLKQGPVRCRPARRPAPQPPSPETEAKVGKAVADVSDGQLRGALDRLGTAVLAAADRHRQADPSLS